MKNENLLSGLVGGAIGGAIFGMLFAPEKGSGVRKKVSDMADEKGEEGKVKRKKDLEAEGRNREGDEREEGEEEGGRRGWGRGRGFGRGV